MDYWIWSVLLLLLALILLIIDVFVPSGGLLASLCAASVVGAVVMGFLSGPGMGLGVLVTSAILFPSIILAAIKVWPHTPIGRLILIQRPQSPDDVLPQEEEYRSLKRLIGKRGVARSKMLPSGIVSLDNRRYDAVSEGVAIEAGQPIRVVAVRTQRIIVRPVAEHEPEEPDEPAKVAAPEDVLSQSVESLGLEPLDDPLA